MLDESPIFSLKIEQNHSSPITKFITDLANTLFNALFDVVTKETEAAE